MPQRGPEGRTVVIGCAALARELRAALAQLGDVGGAVDVHLLPSALHNRPERIPEAVAAAIDEHVRPGDRAVVAYADCGTGGLLDSLLEQRGVPRLPGSHCYELVAGAEVFAALHDEEPGTFYLTEFLARHFEQLVVVGLGLDRHPQLRDTYFGAYRRVVLLAPREDGELLRLGRTAADRLGLEFVVRLVGPDPFLRSFAGVLTAAPAARTHVTSPVDVATER